MKASKKPLKALSPGLGLASPPRGVPPPPRRQEKPRKAKAPFYAYMLDAGVILTSLLLMMLWRSPLASFEGVGVGQFVLLEATTLYNLLGSLGIVLAIGVLVLFYGVSFRWFIGATIGEYIAS